MIKKVGDWNKAHALTKALASIMQESAQQSLMKVGLYAEGAAKKHISNQDLPWRPLSPRTLADKRRRGRSEKIYIDSSTYFQSITSWVVRGKAYAGVKRTATYGGGMLVQDIARNMEFGTSRIPARPLWAPVLAEAKIYWKQHANPARMALDTLKRRFGR